MIVITGAAGFIGSCFVSFLNQKGYTDLVLVDDFSVAEKTANVSGKFFSQQVHREAFFPWMEENHHLIQFVFHLGARTDTTEFDTAVFEKWNTGYSQKMWEYCCRYGIALVYASSAAVYGGGEHGYSDNHSLMPRLSPLNPYGDSKYAFDSWVLSQKDKPYHWAGLRFFNVYGPNEYHKKRMASVVLHAYNQLQEKGSITLFRSHKEGIADGEQRRDFIYVEDICKVLYFLLHHRNSGAIYNLGTGTAETFYELARQVCLSCGNEPRIQFIDTPADIRDKYQYYTCAEMDKLRQAGYTEPFMSLAQGVQQYISKYLCTHTYY